MTPSFNKTRLGFDPFDKALGGIYFYQPTLIWGPRHSGKSLLSAQFAAKVLQTGERVCVMVENTPRDFFLDLQSLNVDVGEKVSSGQLLALSCKGFADVHAAEPGAAGPVGALPFPAAIEELRELATSKSILFFIFNSVIPWVAVPPAEVPARIETFVSALESMQLTSLLLLPRPASPAATHLRDALAEACPVVLQLASNSEADRRIIVTRYRGASKITLPADYPAAILPGRGFVSRDEADGDALSHQLPSLAPRAAQPRVQRHHALLSPSIAGAPPSSAPAASTSFPRPATAAAPAAIPHPRHATRHHAMLPPGAGAPPPPPAARSAAPQPAAAQPPAAQPPAPQPPAPQPPAPQPREGSTAQVGNAPNPGEHPQPAPAPTPSKKRPKHHFPLAGGLMMEGTPPSPAGNAPTPSSTPPSGRGDAAERQGGVPSSTPPSGRGDAAERQGGVPPRRHAFSSVIK